MQILIVEDEPKIAAVLRRGFVEEHYQADIAHDGEDALYKCDVNAYDLIVLDLMIPKVSGMEVCRKIRETGRTMPILMLTARSAVDDKVMGLDTGADDYMTKPFSFVELLARVRALLRRGKSADPVVLTYDNLRLDPASKDVSRGGKKIQLTAREFALLEYFMRYPDVALTPASSNMSGTSTMMACRMWWKPISNISGRKSGSARTTPNSFRRCADPVTC